MVEVAGPAVHEPDPEPSGETPCPKHVDPIGVQLNRGFTKTIEAGRPDMYGVRIEISDAQPSSRGRFAALPCHSANAIHPAVPLLKAPTTDA